MIVATTGSNFDPAGTYGLIRSPPYPYESGGMYDVSVNGSRIIGPVMAGVYSLTLYVPSNCAVSGDNPRSVVLVHDQVVETTFPVTCS